MHCVELDEAVVEFCHEHQRVQRLAKHREQEFSMGSLGLNPRSISAEVRKDPLHIFLGSSASVANIRRSEVTF